MPRLSKIGAACLAAFGWTSGAASVTASYLQVAGGGGAGSGDLGSIGGAGGGAGGLLTGTTSLNLTQSYTVVVGAGGAGGVYSGAGVSGVQGSNSQFGILTASVGGGFGAYGTSGVTGGNGGSGGGGTFGNSGGTATSGQGSNGGTGSSSLDCRGSGGGGGAGAVGSNGSSSGGGNGGNGTASSITGTSVTYAGGGGGGALYRGGGFTVPTVATGGTGGGGNSGTGTGGNGNPGTANLGGGGGGPVSVNAGTFDRGGNGGSGVVIISYPSPQKFGGGVVTSSGGNTIHTFTTSGTLSPLSTLTANFLVIAGAGAGSDYGGGGAGGYRTSAGTSGGGASAESALTIDTNSIYLVTVGAGGTGGSIGTNGSDSVFFSITSTGGGRGAYNTSPTVINGASGGSGGGGRWTGGTGGAGTANQGFAGGNGGTVSGSFPAGGGGGASAVGGNGVTGGNGGNGGAGVASSITGSSVTRAGGGGGGCAPDPSGVGGSGGSGGGGTGGTGGSGTTAGTANTGGGGGGAGTTSGSGGAGGSGIVIISYAGATQLMAGGTVTVAGGNVIHTFTSSGYLTPIVLVTKSLRFRSSASAYLNRTPASAGNRRTWTWSAWVKRGGLSSNQSLFAVNATGDYQEFRFTASNTLQLILDASANNYAVEVPTVVWRDVSAWYHIVLAVDTTQATSTNRVKIYVNGIQQTVSAVSGFSFPAQNFDTYVNATLPHAIGNFNYLNSLYFDGYMTEINLIDGQALTPSSFGTTSDLGVWQPIRYGGSYGTNGFYLPFTNTTSTTTLVSDSSPNGNNWTPNNISLTAGSTYDSMTDVPTLTSATTANYAVLNPLSPTPYGSLSNGNLLFTNAGADWGGSKSTFAIPTTGKWYAEFTIGSTSSNSAQVDMGIFPSSNPNGNDWTGSYGLEANNGFFLYTNGSSSSNRGGTTAGGTVFQIAVDSDAGKVWFGVANSWYDTYNTTNGNPSAGTNPSGSGINFSTTTYFMGVKTYLNNWTANFGQQPFAYTPPTGFVALNTFNLPTPTIGATASTTANKYFDVSLYTGNGSTQSITNAGSFQPDFVWMKSRSPNGYQHVLQDVIRGTGQTKKLYSSLSEEENGANAPFGYLSSFDSNGFSVSIGSSNANQTNASSQTYVGWQWKANGAGVTNTAGSIISTVSANTTTGFSIVTYTGNATSGATVGHGCQVGGIATAPSMVILKSRSLATNWYVYNSNLTSASYQLYLNLDLAEDNSVTTAFNSVAPGATTFTLPGTGLGSNNSGATYVAYCFAAVPGYSAFGKYTGNGADDGVFVFTGFRPRYIVIKRASSGITAGWITYDTARSTYNVNGTVLEAQDGGAEGVNVSTRYIDILSNGFKLRTSASGLNGGSGVYIYMAFAESPFKYANAR